MVIAPTGITFLLSNLKTYIFGAAVLTATCFTVEPTQPTGTGGSFLGDEVAGAL
jgi:hypothetical protein